MSKDRYNQTFAAFIQKTDGLIQQYEAGFQKSASANSADTAALLQLFDEYDNAKHQFRLELVDLVGYIAVRFPEIKEEDNAGVHVQEEVKNAITSILYGGKDGKKDFEVDKVTFLEERNKILAPKEGKDGEKAAADAEADKRKAEQVQALVNKQLQSIQLGWRNLQVQRDTIATFLQNNKDKITEPRRSSSRYHT